MILVRNLQRNEGNMHLSQIFLFYIQIFSDIVTLKKS